MGEKKMKKSVEERKKRTDKSGLLGETFISAGPEKAVRPNKKIRCSRSNKKTNDNVKQVEFKDEEEFNNKVEDGVELNRKRNLKKKKRRNEMRPELDSIEKHDNKIENGINEVEEQKELKSKSKRRRNEKTSEIDNMADEKLEDSRCETKDHVEGSEALEKSGMGTKIRNPESEKEVRPNKKIKCSRSNKKKNDNVKQVESRDEEELDNKGEDGVGLNRKRNLKKKKRRNEMRLELGSMEELDNKIEDGINEVEEQKEMKAKSKKRRNEKRSDIDRIADEKLVDSRCETKNQVEGSEALGESGQTKKPLKAKNVEVSKDDQGLLEKIKDAADEVYQMSSGDEDSSKGMKKWLMEFKLSRPGLKVLQERIDDFITAHEEQEEQARKEKEAQAAEGGWTVVVHHKGRKKTTDSESGIAVGSVAPAAVLDKMSKKKNKDVGLDFYRFQKREAHRNELMMLQSKFEQDKKRIQQLRAQRKFKPY